MLLLAAALGVVLVDAADGLVREAQPELVDDQAEVAEVQRAGEELEAAVPCLARDVRQRVAVERMHPVADRRAERDEVAQRDAIARAIAAHDHVLGPRADVAAHELVGVLEAASAEHDGTGRRASRPRPRASTSRSTRRDPARRSRRAPRRGPRRPGAGRRPASDSAHGPRAPGPPVAISRPRPIRSFRQATGGSSGSPCSSSQYQAGSISSTSMRCSVGIAARDPAGARARARRRPDQAAAQRHRPADRGLALEHQHVAAGLPAARAADRPAMPPPTTITSWGSLTVSPLDRPLLN